uniref:Uncharacterized protein n=1 Tax=Acrobeloides nanus TaxID=290746 RepID=A0A914ER31_9BILA
MNPPSRCQVPSLGQIATHSLCLAIFRANVRWRRLSDVTFELRRKIIEWKLPLHQKQAIFDGLGEAFRELQRWGEKHFYMFTDPKPHVKKGPQRVHRGEHLRLFYDAIVWKPMRYHIDDVETARNIIKNQCRDWPLMKFQFACCYAMVDLLEDRYEFDKIRRRTFKKQLDEHCVYEFWLRVLDDPEEWSRMFRPDRLLISQYALLVFQFAIVHGYFQLVEFLWHRLTEQQQEYIGFLSWKRICFSGEHREMVRFLCEKLCKINATGMVRITWDSFYDKIYKALQGEELSIFDQKDNMRKLECLLENWCPTLRSAMLAKENFRAITDTFVYNRPEAFALLLEYLDENQLKSAREFVDRVYDRKKTEMVKNLRQLVIRKQLTID